MLSTAFERALSGELFICHRILLFIVFLFVITGFRTVILGLEPSNIRIKVDKNTKRRAMKRRILWYRNSSPDNSLSNDVLSSSELLLISKNEHSASQ